MLGQVWMVSGRNRYYTFPHGSLQKILYCEFPGVWNHSASNPGSVTLNRTNPSPIKTQPVVLLQEQISRDHVFRFKQVFRSSDSFSRVHGTKVATVTLVTFPSSFCRISCICVALASLQHVLLAAQQPAMQAAPLSTQCASHCPTPGMC